MILLTCDGLFLERLHMVFSLTLYISNKSVRLAGDFTFGRQENTSQLPWTILEFRFVITFLTPLKNENQHI